MNCAAAAGTHFLLRLNTDATLNYKLGIVSNGTNYTCNKKSMLIEREIWTQKNKQDENRIEIECKNVS